MTVARVAALAALVVAVVVVAVLLLSDDGGKQYKVTLINAGHWLGVAILMGAIIGWWGV